MRRQLAVILAADMVGYTRLMATDQLRTIDLVRSLREIWFEPKISEQGGEVLKRMGDGWLVAFGSVGAFAFAVDASKDAAMAIELPPGAYTATVTGKAGTMGVALVEVYELP